MKARQSPLVRLLMLGVAPRIAIAAVIIVLLWTGFFWASAPLGA